MGSMHTFPDWDGGLLGPLGDQGAARRNVICRVGGRSGRGEVCWSANHCSVPSEQASESASGERTVATERGSGGGREDDMRGCSHGANWQTESTAPT